MKVGLPDESSVFLAMSEPPKMWQRCRSRSVSTWLDGLLFNKCYGIMSTLDLFKQVYASYINILLFIAKLLHLLIGDVSHYKKRVEKKHPFGAAGFLKNPQYVLHCPKMARTFHAARL
jgi:hypothetical protein